MIYLKRILYIAALFFILLSSLLAFLLSTTPGLYFSIKVANLYLPGKIKLHKGAGRLLDHASFNKLSYEDKGIKLEFQHGKLHWQLKKLWRRKLTLALYADRLVIHKALTSTPIPKPPFDLIIEQFNIKRIDLVVKSPTPHSRPTFPELSAEATKPLITDFNLQAALLGTRWYINHLALNTANAHLLLQGQGQSIAPYPLSATLKIRPIRLKPPFIQGSLQLSGDTSLYRWQGQFSGFAQGDVNGRLEHGDLTTMIRWGKNKWQINGNKKEGQLSIHSTLQLPLGTIQANASYEQTKLDAHLTLGANSLDLAGYFPYQWRARFNITEPARLHPLLTPFETTLLGTLTTQDSEHGEFNLTIKPGIYRLPQPNLPPIKFKGGQFSASLTPKALDAQGTFMIDPAKIIHLSWHIPKFRFNTPPSKQPLNGKLTLKVGSLDFLQGIHKSIETIHGQLQMDLTATGTLAHPIWQGDFALVNGSVSLPKSGLVFAPIHARLQTKNQAWQLQGIVAANHRTLTLKGQGDFTSPNSGHITITGDNFPVIKTNNYIVNISPALTIALTPPSIQITGKILIPSAQLKPISFSNTVSLSEDVVFVKKKEAKEPNPFNMTTHVFVEMGNDVALDVKGLHGFLDGTIEVKQAPKTPPSAVGELRVRDGKYNAYGQNLTIDQGQLLFTGGPIDNPALRIRAVRKFSSINFSNSSQRLDFRAANIDTVDIGSPTTVGIEMSGRLNAHKITLFSIPPTLSQSDILSLLLLGKPANQASKSGGQLLLTAISSMNLDSGTKGLQLMEQLKQKLGLDIDLQDDPRYSRSTTQSGENTSLVVTKSLSDRVYISYNMGLLQKDSGVIILKYLLSKYFSVQVTASDIGNGLDLLYTRNAE
jgi:translocation and assembly module TamB